MESGIVSPTPGGSPIVRWMSHQARTWDRRQALSRRSPTGHLNTRRRQPRRFVLCFTGTLHIRHDAPCSDCCPPSRVVRRPGTEDLKQGVLVKMARTGVVSTPSHSDDAPVRYEVVKCSFNGEPHTHRTTDTAGSARHG